MQTPAWPLLQIAELLAARCWCLPNYPCLLASGKSWVVVEFFIWFLGMSAPLSGTQFHWKRTGMALLHTGKSPWEWALSTSDPGRVMTGRSGLLWLNSQRWLLENSMKHETWTEDKDRIRFMPLTAVVFKLFETEEVETTAADVFPDLGIGDDGCKCNGDTIAITIFFFNKSQIMSWVL